jgi:hypothetical protein
VKASGFVHGDPPALDRAGRAFLVLAASDCELARKAVRHWMADASELGRDAAALYDPTPGRAAEAVAALRAGSRILVAGPAAEAMAYTAAARQAGVLPCELITYVTSTVTLTVFCPHCETTQRADARPGDRISCAGCGISLEIRPHLSSHHGTYLGAVA